jgi:inhibitor of cysteine peptidase
MLRTSAPPVLVLLMLAGCAGGPQYPGTPPPLPLMLQESDAGRPIEVERGRKVTIRLQSNRTSGFRWSAASTGEALEQYGEPFYSPESSVPGGGGAEYWSFMPQRAGKQELRFEYRRPWERDAPPARALGYTVTVR